MANAHPFATAMFTSQAKTVGGSSGSVGSGPGDLRRVNSSTSVSENNANSNTAVARTDPHRIVPQHISGYNSAVQNGSASNLLKFGTGQTLTYAHYHPLLTQAQQLKTDSRNNATATNATNSTPNGVVVNGGLDNHAYLMSQWQRMSSHTNTPKPTILQVVPMKPLAVRITAQSQQAHTSNNLSGNNASHQNTTMQSQQSNGHIHGNGNSHAAATPIYLPHNYHQVLLQQQYPNTQFVLPGSQGYTPQQGQQVAFMQFQQT
ncbi:hypothetical protein RFI_17355 [Reticulomyxa filosa]|uniref:Uncharacterized protein n=1 Tax=Reticulomyxa filosa TaxID=46433 RepID=X6N1G6_RETFI|nr:hypothetical protein RFI_17355 [Reticulomyxa filosa]|eukprot:ETO19871.1 hypothetical protein RFI_17355 [Reticulomyxa filosa]